VWPSRAEGMNMTKWSRRQIGIAVLVVPLAGAFLAFDLLMPLGIAGGVPYAIIVMLGLWLPRSGMILVLAALGTLLTSIGYILSPEAGIPWMVVVNRALALLIIWTTAGLAFFLHLQAAATAAAIRVKSDFLSAMSHELRTPMNAILGFAQLLEADTTAPLNDNQSQFNGEILRSGRHLLGLIDTILDLAKIEGNELPLRATEVDPGPVVDGCLDMIAEEAGQNRVALSNRLIDADLPTVQVDALRFRQAVMNLLTNAVKYNQPGGQVIVSGERRVGSLFRISVNDTGQGIAKGMHDQVFAPFERLGSENSATLGAGVDLTFTRQFMKKMGGDIGFESYEGVGSTFWIDIPLARRDEIEA
jgi:signal transduction histidine kinase